MKNTIKRIVLGILVAGSAIGGLTISAHRASAAICDECTTRGFSGYLVASGDGQSEYCESDPAIYQLQGCGE